MAKNRNKWTNRTKWTKTDKRKTASNPQQIRVFRKVCPIFVHLSRISTQRYKIILIFVLSSFFQKLDKWTKLLLHTPQTLGITGFLCEISSVDKIRGNWTKSQCLTHQTLGIPHFLCKISSISQSLTTSVYFNTFQFL